MEKRRLGPCVTFFPQPTTLVSTVDLEGNVNLMTASWAGIVSKTPPMMAVSFNRGRVSYANLKQTGSFVVAEDHRPGTCPCRARGRSTCFKISA